MLLRARVVLPISDPPIEDGAVLISGERIQEVGSWNDLRVRGHGPAADLGEVILLPGFINAHCHLDYTDMAGQLAPARHFSDWIKAMVALKAAWSYTDFAQSWLNGAHMLLHSGTTTVVDIEAVPELLPEVARSSPLRVISCLELITVRSRRSAHEMVEAATSKLRTLACDGVGLSPHAPYSTGPELLRAAGAVAREHDWLLTMHVAESADEFEMYELARGAMYEWLRPQRDMSDCGGCSPLACLARHDVLSNRFLAVHANYLAGGDAELLARSGASVVHCPRSHAFFQHRDFEWAELQKAGVNICLGTDSLATVGRSRTEPLTLDMFSEMRACVRAFPKLSPETVLSAATLNGARALRREHEMGVLAPDAWANLIAVPCVADGDWSETVIAHRGEVTASMIRGEWAISPRT